jgi:hypothetical protein
MRENFAHWRMEKNLFSKFAGICAKISVGIVSAKEFIRNVLTVMASKVD